VHAPRILLGAALWPRTVASETSVRTPKPKSWRGDLLATTAAGEGARAHEARSVVEAHLPLSLAAETSYMAQALAAIMVETAIGGLLWRTEPPPGAVPRQKAHRQPTMCPLALPPRPSKRLLV
jgi:hypothetical protein